MKLYLSALLISLLFFSSFNHANDYMPTKVEIKKATEFAIATSNWFEYKTGEMTDKNEGQCGDYALMFILNFNKFMKRDVARLVVANNAIDSGSYRVGRKIDVKKLGFNGFPSGSSGFLIWNDQIYLYHPVIGAYELFLERPWTPKKHFGVNMLDKRQVHVWASIGDISVDPTYYDIWPDQFKSPLGKDE